MAMGKEPEVVLLSRNGMVLGKKTVLKSDHFPGCQNKRLLPSVDGAPNYRQVDDLPVYGVAIPTVDGIRRVLELVGEGNRRRPILWHNMREEPVIYVNGRPFVLREVERPFTNVEYTGIDRARVEQMEDRLKEDALREAQLYGNELLVSDELPDGQMVETWEVIKPDSLKTPLEVYQGMQAEGFNVEYERVPVTDEKSPKERDFDLLVRRLSKVEEGTALVFNCQMGRGRTTTGTIIACLTLYHRLGIGGVPSSDPLLEDAAMDSPDNREALRRGEYTVIRSLLRVLEGGVDCKRQVDYFIDKCSAMQNLREAILGYRNSITRQADEKRREAALTAFVEYLERYYFLIAFAVYMKTDPSALARERAPGHSGFQGWMRARPELYSVLRRLLRRDPMGALGYRHDKQTGVFTERLPNSMMAHETSPGSTPRSERDSVAAMRQGEVLGKMTMLKSDHFPGCQNPCLPELVEGAPNFRQVAGLPVYGVANPTVDGIRAVLQRVGCGEKGRRVVWHNMREEPMVYINGKPFVLREAERPFKNMLEYTGIDRARVEQMEARLKDDVLREAERYNGAIMVNDENDEGRVFDVWEPVTAAAVLTPLEVYKGLRRAGLLVEYARVPITDGKAPKSRDFDTLTSKIATSGPDTAFVFNCQMGRGRTTTGTVIASLVLTRCTGGSPMRLPPLPSNAVPMETEDEADDIAGSSGDEFPTLSDSGGAYPTCETPVQERADENLAKTPGESHSQQENNGWHSGNKRRGTLLSIEGERVHRRGKRQGTPLRHAGSLRVEEFTLDDFQVIRKITRLFGRVSDSRQTLDGIIDRCAAMHNIRQAVLHYRRQLNQQNIDPRHRRAALNRGVEYLERYYMLIAFTAYLESDAFNPSLLLSTVHEVLPPLPEVSVGTPLPVPPPPVAAAGANGAASGFPRLPRVSSVGSLESYDGAWKLQSPAEVQFGALCTPAEGDDGVMSFKSWLRRRPEIRQMKWNMRLRPFRVFTVPETRSHAKLPAMISHDPLMEVFVHSRRGQVLNHDTVLKMYFFPGQKRNSDHFPIPGAPNVCKVEGVHVHSTATPMVDGIREVLSHLRAGAPDSPKLMHSCSAEVRQSLAVVTDLREEVVVYIKGRPFVVREIQQPKSTLKLAGIEGPVVEALEAQLKVDILTEAEQSGGRMLLHREEVNTGTGDIDVIGYWEEVTPADVVTPKDVYSRLKEEGFNIDYKRICLTRERPPLASDLDAIKKRVDVRNSTNQPVEYLFVSHTGYGGIAYAMAITTSCLETTGSGDSAQARANEAAEAMVSTPRKDGWEEAGRGAEADSADGGGGSAGESPTSPSPMSTSAKEELLRAGEWRDILSLVRVLVQGPACKADVDAVIDRCSSAGRLREDVLEYKKKIDEELEEDRRTYMHDMAIKALRRYSYLIAFRSYLYGQQANEKDGVAAKESFDKWLKKRPELGHLLEHLKLQ